MFGQGSLDKEVWFEEAKRAYEEFFNKRARRGPGLGTFDELEEQAVEAGDRLARFLIENSISAQSTDFDPPEECDCPRCGEPAKRKGEAPDTRELQAKPGAIAFKRQAYYCAPCRRIFFSNGPRTRSEG
jgi:hypothetical protein